MISEKHNANSEKNKSGYETRDVNITKIIGVGLVALVLLAITLVLLKQYFISSTEEQYYDVVLKPESEALGKLHERENEILGSYKVIDREKNIYQIPIDRAIQIMANEAIHVDKPNIKKGNGH